MAVKLTFNFSHEILPRDGANSQISFPTDILASIRMCIKFAIQLWV